jgi:hypothetical protein
MATVHGNAKWTCSRLASVAAAFHRITERTHTVDICEFCGKEFSPAVDAVGAPSAELGNHLDLVHRFRWCEEREWNRSDNFRKHLEEVHKTSHDRLANLIAVCEISATSNE